MVGHVLVIGQTGVLAVVCGLLFVTLGLVLFVKRMCREQGVDEVEVALRLIGLHIRVKREIGSTRTDENHESAD